MNPNKDIFTFSDYRQFMQDYYQSCKKKIPGYSYRLLADAAGFSAPSFPKMVMEGQKNLTHKSILQFARAFKLKKQATEYFENLVYFNQSDSLEEKIHYLEKIDSFRKKNCPRRLLPREYDYLRNWYHCVIREMADLPNGSFEVNEIAKRLRPRIRPEEVKRSVDFLEEAGFLKRNAEGVLEKADKTLMTGDIRDQDMLSTIARKHHLTMVDQARDAIKQLSREQRSVTNTTLSLSRESYEKALKQVANLRLELLELAAADDQVTDVYQLNINLFPWTKQNGEN